MKCGTVPGPSGAEALRWWARMVRNPLATYLGLQRAYGDAVRIPFRRNRPLLLLSRPEHAEHVLVAHQRNYVKAITYRPLRAFLGSGLLTSEGEIWERHRGIIQPVFARRQLSGFAPDIVAAAQHRTAMWRDGDIVDVSAQMRALTLEIVGRVLFGAPLGGFAQRVGDALAAVQHATVVGVLLAGAMPQRLSWGWLRRIPGVAGPANRLDGIVSEIIAQRRSQPRRGGGDLLDLLLTAGDRGNSTLDDAELRDEVLTLMLAGHETTSNALTWALALLSRFPAARRRLEAEADDVLAGRPADADDVDRLCFTEAVINEAMRLYPPAWTLERDAIDVDDVAGIPVTAGTTVVVPPYLLHRHPEFWPDPEGFDPQRFLTDTDRPRYAFMPFGGGRRICVGAGFAMFEAKLLLASITQEYRLDLVSSGMPTAQAEITLRPRGPVPMRLVSRRNHADDGPQYQA
ncbi:cytochrome P450 [Mycobacterium haemophilum]